MSKKSTISFWHYGIAIIVPILFVVASLYIILSRINSEIDFTNIEHTGLVQVQKINSIITDLQKVSGLSYIQILRPTDEVKLKLDTLNQNVVAGFNNLNKDLSPDTFKVAGLVANVEKKVLSIDIGQNPNFSQIDVFDKYSALIHQINDISQKIATRSKLLLDHEVESYYIMSLVVNILPDLSESLGLVRGLGSGLLSKEKQSEVDLFSFASKLNSLQQSLDKISRTEKIILESSPNFKELFTCFTIGQKQYLDDFLKLSDEIKNNRSKNIDAKKFFHEGSIAIKTTSVCNEKMGDMLLLLLKKRVSNLEMERAFIIFGLVLALLFMIIFFSLFYRHNINALESLRVSVEKNRAILQSAVDGIVTINEKGIIQSTNSSLENIFGYAPGTLLGKNISILMPNPHRDKHDAYLENYLVTRIKNIIGSIREVEGICPDGGVFPLELSVSEYKVEGKTYYTGILHDITERKQAKEALHEAYNELERRVIKRTKELEVANQQLKQEALERDRTERGLRMAAKVFENASEAIVITDPDANIIDVNQAYTIITGFEKADVIGKNPSIGQSGRHDQAFYELMWKTLLSKDRWSGEIWDRNKQGKIYPKWLTINAVKDKDNKLTNYVGIFSDISRIKATEQRLEQLAFYDPLTNLPNRMLFQDRLTLEFEDARRHHKQIAVMFIDLDRFKIVNDTLGHAAGDQLLIEISRRLTDCVRSSDTVSRLGGDEFTVILTDIEDGKGVAHIASKIIFSLQKTVEIKEHHAHVGASIGIAIFPDDGEDFETITKHADVAMYHAKDSGRGNFKFFKDEMNAKSSSRMKLETELHDALDQDQFVLHFQPKLDIESGTIRGMEALVRWQRSDGSMVPPFQFIPLAEEIGLIIPMGKRILEMACNFNKHLLEVENIPLKVAVNLSPRQFQQVDIHKMVETVLKETGLPAKYLELEVTESMMMDDSEKATSILNQFRDLDLSISMDDFGTGYSSLSYLKKFPINTLKIDQSFVRDLTIDSDDAAIVSAIVSMAKSLKLRVVAEGVETVEQLEFLKNIGCQELQGYLISRPVPAEEFSRFIKEKRFSLDELLNNKKSS
ncbi:MAG: EAL domain-containing protein [Magnetococcales bacterium]|nr:EAL domain-containing protein [Magnetococcales bacterium]